MLPHLATYAICVGTGPDSYWFDQELPLGSTDDEKIALIRLRWPELKGQTLHVSPF